MAKHYENEMDCGASQEEILAGCQQAYAKQGYLVVACKNPHSVDECIWLDDYVLNVSLWRVLAPSTVEELLEQMTIAGFSEHVAEIEATASHPYFYRVEALDIEAFQRKARVQ